MCRSAKNAASIKIIGFLLFFILIFSGAYHEISAQQISSPVLVATSPVDGATLGIPRWKGYMSETDPNSFWLSYANASSSGGNINYTTDGGASWSSNVIQIDQNGWMDYHLSLFGKNNTLYYTWPGASNAICFRRFNPPAHSNNDRGPIISFSGTNNTYRSNISVQNSGRIWVFTRVTGDASQNVRYQYSDDNGNTWISGQAFSTGSTSIRIGSMPYINDNPALIVLYLSDNRGFQYYLWNGSSFVAQNDHSIYPANMNEERAFTHNVVNDSSMHLIFSIGANLHHCWKYFNGGNGAWNHEIIDNCPNNLENEYYPISTVQGDNLYVFYCKKSDASATSSKIYYKKWSQISQTWTPPALVSDALPANRDPNTCIRVPAQSNYIPVFWNSYDGSTRRVFFSKIINEVQPPDTIPPARIMDLGGIPGGVGQVNLTWTAPGDDGNEGGSAAAYEIRYSRREINESTWGQAELFPYPPAPLSPGISQSFTLAGLEAGLLYYLGMKAYDDIGNVSGLSNIALSFSGGRRQHEKIRSSIWSQLIR
jgi:hypothetical protein